MVARLRWAGAHNKRCPLMDGTSRTLAQPCMSGQLYLTIRRAMSKTTSAKSTILTHVIWTTPKDIATKSGESHVRVRALQSCKFSRPSVRNICLWAKIHIFPYRRILWGLPWTVPCYTISVCNQPTRPTQPFILTGSINRVPTWPVGVKAGRSPLSGGR